MRSLAMSRPQLGCAEAGVGACQFRYCKSSEVVVRAAANERMHCSTGFGVGSAGCGRATPNDGAGKHRQSADGGTWKDAAGGVRHKVPYLLAPGLYLEATQGKMQRPCNQAMTKGQSTRNGRISDELT